MKMVVRDYFGAFRWTKIKECYKSSVFGNWFLVVYLFVIFPGLFLEGREIAGDAVGLTIQYLVVMFLIAYGLFAAPLHPVGLSKLMYLCPMSEAERRKYVYQSYVFKVGFGMALTVVGVLVLIFTTGLNVAYGCFVIFAELGIVVCDGNVTKAGIRACVAEKKSIVFGATGDVVDSFALVIAVFIGFYLGAMVELNQDMDLTMTMVVACAMIVLEVPLMIYSIKKVKPTLEAAVRYER